MKTLQTVNNSIYYKPVLLVDDHDDDEDLLVIFDLFLKSIGYNNVKKLLLK